MSIKFPEYVQIGGMKFKVLFPYTFKEKKESWGQTDLSLHEIRIGSADGGGTPVPDDFLAATFFHELLHAISDVFMYCELKDERDIDAIAQGLTQVFMAGQLPKVEE